jgi:hypothetical protein
VRPDPDVNNRDDLSVNSSDDWGTPPPRRRKQAANERSGFSHSESISITSGKYSSSSTINIHSLTVPDHDALDNNEPQIGSIDNSRSRPRSPRLFVAENEEVLVTKGTTELNRPKNILHKISGMDGLKRARAIKASIRDNIAVLQSPQQATSDHSHVEDGAENQLIMTMRQDQKMSWSDIANYLNQERRKRGEAANFTDAAVYSRFIRSATRIATPVGNMGFDPKDYQHLRNPSQYTNTEGTGTLSKVGKKRIKNYNNAKELEANIRQQSQVDTHDELETVEKTEQLMQAVAKVERNFWVLVADEMERATTKLYPPDVLASRYHAI